MHLFVNNLTNVDFSYLHPKRGLIGETWLASITLEGVLDDQGMVCDFGVVKKTVRNWLDETIDHCLLIPSESTHLISKQERKNIKVEWNYGAQKQFSLSCSSPSQAYALINTAEISEQSVSEWCVEQLKSLLPNSIDNIQLRFKPEAIEHSFYHYSHGLKKHLGNCQRIAHGHRSTLAIYRNGQRDYKLEKDWCHQWQDIYIGTEEDLVSAKHNSHYSFRYDSQQGSFDLQIPKEHCHLIDTDSTVEFIAQHIAEQLKLSSANDQFEVHAFEGVGKGAIAFS
jgi:6-pyruvoyl-tetrahydropterin synthase